MGMRISFWLIACVWIAHAADSTPPLLSLEHSSLCYHPPTDQLILTASLQSDASKQIVLTWSGQVLPAEEMDKLVELSTRPLFASELAIISMVAFLKPFYDRIAWKTILRSDFDPSLLIRFPRTFWQSIHPTQIAHLLSSLKSSADILTFLAILKDVNIDLDEFVTFATMAGTAHGVMVGKSPKRGQFFMKLEAMKMTISMLAEQDMLLVAKLYTDGDHVQQGQPMYLYEAI